MVPRLWIRLLGEKLWFMMSHMPSILYEWFILESKWSILDAPSRSQAHGVPLRARHAVGGTDLSL